MNAIIRPYGKQDGSTPSQEHFWKHSDYFDEMINMSITILKYIGLHSHQILINSISLMKRESEVERAYPTPQMMNFSFREQFDEILMRVYIGVTQ